MIQQSQDTSAGYASTGAAVRALQSVRPLWIMGVVAALAIWLFLSLAFRGQPGDDPYITYRYAYNVAHGNGFVFNLGERVQSTTTPLLALLLAAGGALGFDIPTLGYFFSTLCLLGFGVCFVRLVSRQLSPWVGLAVVALTLGCQVTTFGLGGEMPLLMMLMWGAWLAAARERWVAAAALSALAVVTRGDGVLVGLGIALTYIYAHRKVKVARWSWSAALVYVVLAAPWYLFAWLYFGSPVPATLGAKVFQGSVEGTPSFLEGLVLFWARSFSNVGALWIPALVLLALGLVRLVRLGGALAPAWVWVGLFVLGFGVLLRVPRYPWYYCPLVPPAMLALVLGGVTVAEWGARYITRLRLPISAAGGGLLVTSLLTASAFIGNDIQAARPEPSARTQLYMTSGTWLAKNLPAGSSLGADEVGLLGYYSKRRIIDFVGLIQPEVAPHRAHREFTWVLKRYKPDYIFALPVWLASMGVDPWVAEHYKVVHTFPGTGKENGTLLKFQP